MSPLSRPLLNIRVLIEKDESREESKQFVARALEVDAECSAGNFEKARRDIISAVELHLFCMTAREASTSKFVLEVAPELTKRWTQAAANFRPEVWRLRAPASAQIVVAGARVVPQ